MKDILFKEIISFLKKDEVKEEFELLSKITMDFILNKLNPYMYVIITMMVIIFLINIVNFALFIYLFRKHHKGNFLI